MSATQNAQLLSETAQAGEANACCMALGGDIIVDSSNGDEICSFETYEFPLSMACQTAQNQAIQGASPEQQSAGSGFVAGFTGILDALGSATTNVLGALNPQQAQGQMPSQSQYVSPVQSNSGKQILTIAVAVLLIAVLVIVLRRKK